MSEQGIVLPGWSCEWCHAFNGEAKDPRIFCRACGLARLQGVVSVIVDDSDVRLVVGGLRVWSEGWRYESDSPADRVRRGELIVEAGHRAAVWRAMLSKLVSGHVLLPPSGAS